MKNEDALIKTIQNILSKKARNIGDDCAVLELSPGKDMLVTTDMLIQGIDFDFTYCDYEDVGYKSVMVNCSDIAAMGGKPISLLFSIGFPKKSSSIHLRRFYKGVKKALVKVNANALGGDLSASEKWVISVTAVGDVSRKNIKYRCKAKPGDILFITGNLGWSAAGLELLRQKYVLHSVRKIPKELAPLIKHHLRPVAQVRAGLVLGRIQGVSAMIDISDGLSIDLQRICKASECGAIIYKGKLPVDSKLEIASEATSCNPYHWVLHGGEDYSLLYTCRRESIRGMRSQLSCKGISCVEVGRICSSKSGLSLIDRSGKRKNMPILGFDHFNLLDKTTESS